MKFNQLRVIIICILGVFAITSTQTRFRNMEREATVRHNEEMIAHRNQAWKAVDERIEKKREILAKILAERNLRMVFERNHQNEYQTIIKWNMMEKLAKYSKNFVYDILPSMQTIFCAELGGRYCIIGLSLFTNDEVDRYIHLTSNTNFLDKKIIKEKQKISQNASKWEVKLAKEILKALPWRNRKNQLIEAGFKNDSMGPGQNNLLPDPESTVETRW